MRQIVWLLMAWVTVGGMCFGQIDREIILKMEKDAAVKGVADAKIDFALGVYRIEKYGMFSDTMGTAEKYLSERYGVKIKSVAGCIIDGMIVNHAQTYNETMKRLLTERFRGDVFAEAERVAPIYAKGEEEARTNFDRGVYSLKEYGDWGRVSIEQKYLREQYKITVDNGGCVVNEEIFAYACGYNATMRESLNKKHGKDIFKEAADFAKQQNER